MKLIGLMSWFDEPESFIARAVQTAAASGVDTIVAVDGAYALLPGAQAASPPKQAKLLVSVARDAGVDLVLVQPREVWPTEVEKRDRLFAVGLACAEPGVDWFLVMDADYEISFDRRSLVERLQVVEEDVATVHAWTPPGPNGEVTFGPPTRMDFPALFRAQRIRLERNHYTYVGENTEGALWGNGAQGPLAPAASCSDIVKIVHWTYHRPRSRNARQYDYYRARDKEGGERGPCVVCGGKASAMVPCFEKDGERVYAMLRDVCGDHHADVLRWQLALAKEWGVEEMALQGVEGP